MNANEIDYQIFGEEMQYVSIELDPQETVIAEPGAFMMMEDGIQMETLFGDGSQENTGFFGKLFLMMAGAAKGNYGIIIFAALNMVVSFYYYLKVVKSIFMDENTTPLEKLEVPTVSKIAMYICVAGVIVTGLASVVYDYIYALSIGL
jgi:hypothetical protein